jgi:hypothetical protein
MDPCPRAARVYDRSKIVFLGGYSRTNHASHATIMALHPCGCISECEGSRQGSLHIPVCANRLRFWAAAVVNDASWSKSSGTTKRASPIGGALSPYPRQRCVFSATTSSEIDAAFATIARDQADALFVALDAFFTSHRGQFATLAARDRLPTNCANRAMVEAGLLMSYGTSVADMFRQVRIYRSDSQWREARRSAGVTVDQIRIRHQPAEGKSTRHRGAELDPIARRRSDRINHRRCARRLLQCMSLLLAT